MTAEVFESSIELAVEVLEPVLPELGTCGPFQKLQRTGQVATRSFHTVALQNPYMRVDVVTELGGRIGRILDRRTGVAVLDLASAMKFVASGCRGVEMIGGISLTYDGSSRPNDLGPVDWQIEPVDDEGVAGLWIGENNCGPIGMHVHFTLPSDAGELTLEARIFDRSGQAVHYNGGLRFGGPFEFAVAQSATLAWDVSRNAGLCFWTDEHFKMVDQEGLFLARFDRLRSMAPRQLDTWSITLMPVAGVEGTIEPHRGGVAARSDTHLQVLASREHPGSKLAVRFKTGEQVETLLDIPAWEVVAIPFEQIGDWPALFSVQNQAKESVAFFDRSGVGKPRWRTLGPPEDLDVFPDHGLLLKEGGFRWSWRATSERLEGRAKLLRGRYEKADHHFEQSLLYNGEDHLTWWLKAAANRHLNREGDNPELLNAHYLAPLEPALRAEAFLEQPIAPTSEPNPLLKPFDENPNNFVEVACLLTDAGLLGDASRWIDEALRHVDLAMLDYLQAYCHLVGSKLEIEASHQVSLAAKLPLAPPFPFRRVERIALEKLRERFPNDVQLERYWRIAVS